MAFSIAFREPIVDHFDAPASKPESQRALLSACLADGSSTISGFLRSNETRAMVEACKMIGAGIDEDGDAFRVHGLGHQDVVAHSMRKDPLKDAAYVWASGSALVGRVFATLGSALPRSLIVDGNANLRSRPLAPLVRLLEEKGVRFNYLDRQHCWPCVALSSTLPGGTYQLATSTSSQFATALLITAPLAHNETSLVLTGENYSLSYILQTVDMMRRFGVPVEIANEARTIVVPAASRYQPNHIRLTGDFTSASYLMGAAFVTRGSVTIDNLDPKSLQGERAMVDILDSLGVDITWRDDGFLHVNCTHLPGQVDVAINLRNSPNILPTVAAIASTIEGRVRITGARLTQFHKSPRIEAMAAELNRAGVDLTILQDKDGMIDGLEIRGRRVQPGGVTFADHGDHRIFMSLALFAMTCREACTFEGSCDTTDSFPAFHDLLHLESEIADPTERTAQRMRTVA